MHSPSPTIDSAYTTIPISASDAISRSFQNISTFVSRHRPWPEFLSSAGDFTRPDSLAAASSRVRLNSKYFGVNYTLIISTCAAASLIGAPFSLIVFALVFVLWLALFFFREDPLMVWGNIVSNQVVTAGLVLITVIAVWFTGMLNNLLIGVSAGILVSAVHGVFRNPEGLFLDENDALASGLIGFQSGQNVYRV